MFHRHPVTAHLSSVARLLHALMYRWLAPEVVTHQQYSKASDVYSFGVILWELLTWKLPWEDLGPFQVGLRVNSLPGCCDKCCKGGKRAAWHASLRADRPQVLSRQLASSPRLI